MNMIWWKRQLSYIPTQHASLPLILRFLENEAGASVETSIKANTNETTTSSLYLNMYKRGKKYLISMIFKKEKEKQDGKFKLWHFEFCSLT